MDWWWTVSIVSFYINSCRNAKKIFTLGDTPVTPATKSKYRKVAVTSTRTHGES